MNTCGSCLRLGYEALLSLTEKAWGVFSRITILFTHHLNRSSVPASDLRDNVIILSLLEGGKSLVAARQLAHRVFGDFSRPNTGVMFRAAPSRTQKGLPECQVSQKVLGHRSDPSLSTCRIAFPSTTPRRA